MKQENDPLKQKSITRTLGKAVSINDLRDEINNGKRISEEELRALQNFELYRDRELSGDLDDQAFNNKYIQLQVMANLSPFQEFLKDEYNK